MRHGVLPKNCLLKIFFFFVCRVCALLVYFQCVSIKILHRTLKIFHVSIFVKKKKDHLNVFYSCLWENKQKKMPRPRAKRKHWQNAGDHLLLIYYLDHLWMACSRTCRKVEPFFKWVLIPFFFKQNPRWLISVNDLISPSWFGLTPATWLFFFFIYTFEWNVLGGKMSSSLKSYMCISFANGVPSFLLACNSDLVYSRKDNHFFRRFPVLACFFCAR